MKTKILSIMVACLLAISVSAKAEVGVTDTEVVVGTWGPLTGPASVLGTITMSFDAYFKFINSLGGIHGRRIRLIMKDDAYNPKNTLAVVKELVEKDKVFCLVGGLGTQNNLAVQDYLFKNKVPNIAPATGHSSMSNPPRRYRFCNMSRDIDQGRALMRWAAEKMGKKKIALLYQNDSYGEEGMQGVEVEEKRLGVSLLCKVPVSVRDADLSAHALRLQKSGADTIIIYVTPRPAVRIVKECHKIGFHPQFLSTTANNDPIMFKLAGDDWNGTIVVAWYIPFESYNPLAIYYRLALKKFAPKMPLGVFSASGHIYGEILTIGLDAAGRNLTREGLVKALESIKNVSGWSHNLSFGPNKRQGQSSVYFVQAKNGIHVPISDWITIGE